MQISPSQKPRRGGLTFERSNGPRRAALRTCRHFEFGPSITRSWPDAKSAIHHFGAGLNVGPRMGNYENNNQAGVYCRSGNSRSGGERFWDTRGFDARNHVYRSVCRNIFGAGHPPEAPGSNGVALGTTADRHMAGCREHRSVRRSVPAGACLFSKITSSACHKETSSKTKLP